MSKEENNSELEEVAMQSITLSGEERKAAYAWLARRDGNTSAATEASFQRWLCDSPRNRRAYDEASRLWAMMGAPAAAVAAGGECRPPVRRHTQRSGFFAPAALVASIILTACAALLIFSSNMLQDWRADVVTAYGQIREYPLPDGSTVTLGPDTALALDFDGSARRDVEILRGQAFFEVRHGLPAPFTVEAGKGRVEVTGTAFDVDRLGDDVTVVVETGSVKVSGSGENAALLGASEMVDVDDGVPGSVRNVDTSLALGWMNGQVSFDRQPVDKVMATLQRYLPARVVTRGKIGERLVSGSFPTDDPEQAIQAIASTVDARVQRLTPWLIVIY
ncbi:FecR family protein [Martelella sp. UBA3392]|uniref:FecR family protein n=1 Tax=Martelella sp. UBA3392 TaxID=1946834 RepID=UPI0031F5A38E